jgi:Sporulation and spore germination
MDSYSNHDRRPIMKLFKFFGILAMLFLTGCGTLEIGIERRPEGTVTAKVAPTFEWNATDTVTLPSPTVVSIPPVEPSPTTAIIPPTDPVIEPTAPPAESSPTPGHQFVQIYLIGIDDNGQSGQLVGCGDSAIPVSVEIPPTKEVLRASLEKLLSLKEQFYGESGLYNSLYQSDLQLDKISLENGKAEIYLTGTVALGGVCDNPRFEAQLESTVLQFSTIQEVSIFVNGKPLKDVLSLKG